MVRIMDSYSFSSILDILLLSLLIVPSDFSTSTSVPIALILFTKANHSLSSRALGWDTNDPSVPDRGWDQVCSNEFPSSTFVHIGYTGTLLCIDTEQDVYLLLLSNRVYPSDDEGELNVRALYRRFTTAVAIALSSNDTIL